MTRAFILKSSSLDSAGSSRDFLCSFSHVGPGSGRRKPYTHAPCPSLTKSPARDRAPREHHRNDGGNYKILLPYCAATTHRADRGESLFVLDLSLLPSTEATENERKIPQADRSCSARVFPPACKPLPPLRNLAGHDNDMPLARSMIRPHSARAPSLDRLLLLRLPGNSHVDQRH